MITGVRPARHGIWNNNVFGPTDNNRNNHYFYQDIQAKTIFDAAAEKGNIFHFLQVSNSNKTIF